MIVTNPRADMLRIARFMGRTIVYHGVGSSSLVGQEAVKCRISKAMIVTDRGVHRAGLLDGVQKSLGEQKIAFEVFDGVTEDADVTTVQAIVQQIKATRCDGILVVGGGSPICAAKGAAVTATNKVQSIRELEGGGKAVNPPLPVICLPSTAGSGSDVSNGFPILDREAKRHMGVSGETIAPPVSLLDPVLLETCPLKPALYAAVDALSHPLEALWSTRSTAISDALAYQAIALIMQNLKLAVTPGNLLAKMNQQIGCTLGMLAGDTGGLALVHGLGGVVFSLQGPHGLKCGIFLRPALEFNLPVCAEKYARLAVMLGESSNKSTEALARSFVEMVNNLLDETNFPKRFTGDALSGTPQDILAEVRRTTPPFLNGNLRKVTDEDVLEVLKGCGVG